MNWNKLWAATKIITIDKEEKEEELNKVEVTLDTKRKKHHDVHEQISGEVWDVARSIYVILLQLTISTAER